MTAALVAVICLTCRNRWTDTPGTWAGEADCTCPCPPELERWIAVPIRPRSDRTLPHQIILTFAGNLVAVSCNCLRTPHRPGGVGYRPLAARSDWGPGEAFDTWLDHMASLDQERADHHADTVT